MLVRLEAPTLVTHLFNPYTPLSAYCSRFQILELKILNFELKILNLELRILELELKLSR